MIELEDRPEKNPPGKFASAALDKMLLEWHTEVTENSADTLARSVLAQAVDSARIQGLSVPDLLSRLRVATLVVESKMMNPITEEEIEEFLGAIPVTEEVEYDG